jgi:phosphoglycolate phosphatase-like HAD superfamily hydrolase
MESISTLPARLPNISQAHPAMLLEIMDELGVMAPRAVVGDTTHDLQMARNAGVDAIGMTRGAHPVDQLRARKPLVAGRFCWTARMA